MNDWFGSMNNGMNPQFMNILAKLIGNGVSSAKAMGGNGLIANNPLPMNDMSSFQNINPFNNYFQNARPNAMLAERAGTNLADISRMSSPTINSTVPTSGSSGLFGDMFGGNKGTGAINGLGDLLGQGGTSGNLTPVRGGMGSGDFTNLFSALSKILGNNRENPVPQINLPQMPNYGGVQFNPQPFRPIGRI